MANTPTTSFHEIRSDPKFEDYRSLKQYYRHHVNNEWYFAGYQTSTNAFAEFTGTEHTIAVPAADGYAYAWTEADLAALDGDSIYIDYINAAGAIHLATETKYDSTTSTDTQIPVAHVSGTRHDTVASVAGDTITMTALNSSTANDLAGLTVLGLTGDQAGATLTIASNTAASPTVITCTTTPNANWAADTVAIGTFPSDIYRIRRAWVETESPADNSQFIGDIDGSNIYAAIPDASSRSNYSRYCVPVSYDAENAESGTDYITHAYLGYVKAAGSHIQKDATSMEVYLSITFTPYQIDANEIGGAPSDVTIQIPIDNKGFVWEPCIRLEPLSDVIFKIKHVDDDDHSDIFLEYKILEVTDK